MAALPVVRATSHSTNSYRALIARHTETTRNGTQRRRATTPRRINISRATKTGTKP